MYIAIDFDGTIVTHEYPEIGQDIGALEWLKKFQEAGAKLILWTMRHDSEKSGPVLTDAIDFCKDNGIMFYGHNENPDQHWSDSNKAYAHVYIDDAAFGCPLIQSAGRKKPYVDWSVVGPTVLDLIKEKYE